MSPLRSLSLGLSLLLAPLAPAAQELRACDQPYFQGHCESFGFGVRNLRAYHFNDRMVSVEVLGGRWLLCEHADFRGDCVILRHPVEDLAELDLDAAVSSLRPLARGERGGEPRVGVELFEHAQFRGRSAIFTFEVGHLGRYGWNDLASSVRVLGGAWELCRHSRFRDCQPVEGDLLNLGTLGLNDQVSSLRPLGFEFGPRLERKDLGEE
ncbi:MAG: beta/gamma crystallin-related protein [Xanthomonadales bacterium]|nr:beta/gamma crystallin-related protein [Xanthomonadales bacterium]